MSNIEIKDLPESLDLDRKAMLAISGGARLRGNANFAGRLLPRDPSQIIDFPKTIKVEPAARQSTTDRISLG